jgi:hypothetical protein
MEWLLLGMNALILLLFSREKTTYSYKHLFNRNDQHGIYSDIAIGYGSPLAYVTHNGVNHVGNLFEADIQEE